MNSRAHWEDIYRRLQPTEVSWFQSTARVSCALIQRADVELSTPIIDVGSGASVLADELLAMGYHDVTVLDISATALSAAQARLGERAREIRWMESDVLEADLPAGHYGLWHDRAAFHFLTTVEDRARYLATMERALGPNGYVLIATFASDGPPRCSGLDVSRYSAKELAATFGHDFRLIASEREEHVTPTGGIQRYTYGLFRRGVYGQSSAVSGQQ